MKYTVSPEWLHENLNDKDLVLLDCSLASTIDGQSSELEDQVIPGARFFDLKQKFSDLNAEFPNTLPSPSQFETECRAIGIDNNSKVVVYDNLGVYSSPRVWWMFQAMGHENVLLLDGGLPAWVSMGFPVTTSELHNYPIGNFKANFNNSALKEYEDIKANLSLAEFQVIDARSEGRFHGTASEPRKHLKSGHIAGSENIPYGNVLDNGQFKSPSALKSLFQDKVNNNQLVYSCGSGLTACIIMLAGKIAGYESIAVYDGSWTEWAERENLKEDVD